MVRELTPAKSNEVGSGRHVDACAVVFSFKDVYSFNAVAQRVIREDIRRLMESGRRVIVIDPNRVLKMEGNQALEANPPPVVNDENEARLHIGGTGCRLVSHSDGVL